MNHKRLIFFCSASLLIIITIFYFGFNYIGTNKMLTLEQATKEYQNEATTLKLAPGWKWPDKPLPSRAPDGNSEVKFEKGFAKSQADTEWFCSWIGRATNTKLSEKKRQRAFKNVLAIRSKYFYTDSLTPDSKPEIDQMLRKAKDGKTDKMKQFFELNCKGQ